MLVTEGYQWHFDWGSSCRLWRVHSSEKKNNPGLNKQTAPEHKTMKYSSPPLVPFFFLYLIGKNWFLVIQFFFLFLSIYDSEIHDWLNIRSLMIIIFFAFCFLFFFILLNGITGETISMYNYKMSFYKRGGRKENVFGSSRVHYHEHRSAVKPHENTSAP